MSSMTGADWIKLAVPIVVLIVVAVGRRTAKWWGKSERALGWHIPKARNGSRLDVTYRGRQYSAYTTVVRVANVGRKTVQMTDDDAWLHLGINERAFLFMADFRLGTKGQGIRNNLDVENGFGWVQRSVPISADFLDTDAWFEVRLAFDRPVVVQRAWVSGDAVLTAPVQQFTTYRWLSYVCAALCFALMITVIVKGETWGDYVAGVVLPGVVAVPLLYVGTWAESALFRKSLFSEAV